ncbi:methyltransferase [Myxococcaceae bacterium GXIMD 01537]
MSLPTDQVAPTVVLQMVFGKMASRAITLAAELSLADLMKDGPVHVDELARARDVNADALNRVLRVLAASGVFTEVSSRTFGLNPAAQLLRSDVPGSLRGLVLWLGDDTSWRAFQDLRKSVKTGLPAYDEVHGHALFDYLARTPSVGAIFNQAMTSLTGQFMPAVLAAYDFSGLKRVVDVGGGQGALLAALVERYPELRCTLMDLPEVVAQAGAVLDKSPHRNRLDTAPGSFFDTVPAGADAYVLKHILHDWDDAHSLSILRNIRKAMPASGRLLVVETLITPGPESLLSKFSDLEMLVVTPSGRERTAEEFSALFQQAGLRLERVVQTPSPMVVLEARPAGE